MDELKVFQDAQPELERWRQRQVRIPPEQPEQGSDLGDDDKAFEYFPISEMVRINLISAGEHLRLVWDGLSRKNMYTTAQHTAIRGALVGASQAVWITAPEDQKTRLRRGHAVIAESYEQLRRYHQRRLELAADHGLSREEQQRIQDHVGWIRSRQQGLAAVQPAPMSANVTDALRDIAPVLFPTDLARQARLRLAWNVLSSDAHVLAWGIAGRATFSAPDRNSVLSMGITGGHLGELADLYDLTTRTLRCGWSLFDRRCEGR
ncbi:hypothetical protein [Nocardia grenadensis]